MEVGIRELKNHLSRYLERVRDGDEVVVTDRGRAIARVGAVRRRTGPRPPYRRRRRHAGPAQEAASDEAHRHEGTGVGPRRRATQVIAYFDTSAVVPLLIAETGSRIAGTVWDSADRIVSIRLVYPEARAALAQAERLDRLTARDLRRAVSELDSRFEEMDLVEIDDALAHLAGEKAEEHALRGYDAVHLAAALRVHDPDVVLIAGDRALVGAANSEGLAVAQLT